jgi:hypothetical protein
MPDGWELKNKLNPHDSGDGILISGKSGYSNLEIYLNNLVNKLY